MPRKKTISTAIYFNKYKPQKDGKCPISIRITFDRQKRFYDTGIRLQQVDFYALYAPKLKPSQKTIKSYLDSLELTAQDCVRKLSSAFTFSSFEKIYLSNRSLSDFLHDKFNHYIDEIESGRVGTISSYKNARDSFRKFKSGAKVAEITVRFLNEYEQWMLSEGKSITTVGIYCRNLRSLLNSLIADGQISRELYPFGSYKNKKYEIPTSKNTKKALSINEISKIFKYKCINGSTKEMCRDYWIFLYLANGINIKDFCLLKWKNIDGDIIKFIREKTKRTKKQVEMIKIVVQKEMFEIIEKWGNPDRNLESYVFPHLKNKSSANEVRASVNLLGRLVNDHMKAIAKDVGLDKPVRTYEARHSFATILKNSGAPVAMISQALGHSSLATTQSYLASFENKMLREATTVLTKFD